jgi:regulator of replication initiation timing
VASAPKRNRKRYGKVTAPVLIPTAPTKRAPTKPRFQEQVLAILRNELGYAEKRITRRIAALVSEITTENVRIVLENKELRSYKKDSEVTRNDSNSPLMERHYMKAGD